MVGAWGKAGLVVQGAWVHAAVPSAAAGACWLDEGSGTGRAAWKGSTEECMGAGSGAHLAREVIRVGRLMRRARVSGVGVLRPCRRPPTPALGLGPWLLHSMAGAWTQAACNGGGGRAEAGAGAGAESRRQASELGLRVGAAPLRALHAASLTF